MKQRDAFLESEGDAWFERNTTGADAHFDPDSDLLLAEILLLSPESRAARERSTRILEIGCGDGSRLAWLQENRSYRCFGLDPSEKAVAAARERGIDARQGTAEELPFDDASLDIVVFGFCLYLCDREDLFRIACEADRVLKDSGWLLILDFYTLRPMKREYHHRAGLFSYKMDYTTLFSWHPAYTVYSHKLCHHAGGGYTDDPQEWIATSVLRKNLGNDE
jgi:ubiquinone/menaquinone biosynthesis C-methylase UbiE